MPTKKLSVKLSPVVATVIRPVATRLKSIEDLLVEMRGVLDFLLKRITALQKQADILVERIASGDPDEPIVGWSTDRRATAAEWRGRKMGTGARREAEKFVAGATKEPQADKIGSTT
jgi:hypothetical protein